MNPYYERDGITIYHGDCLDTLKSVPSESVDCCVTSPPYWGLRDYGVDGQLGLEKTPEEYTAKMVQVFREVKRVLKKEGTCWLNLGDSYNSHSTGNGNVGGIEGKRKNKCDNTANTYRQTAGIKDKDLVGIPWRVAFALQADGWYLRQDIIWHKPNPMPESVTDRCTKSHEYIFLLAKSQKYFYDNQAIQEQATWDDPRMVDGFVPKSVNGKHILDPQNSAHRKQFSKSQGGGVTSFLNHSGSMKGDGEPIGTPGKRNKRSVWTYNTSPFSGAHFATFPEDLIEPMIKAGCPEKGVVLDPFFGAGTTGVVAKNQNRKAIGIDLNEKYCEIAVKRIEAIPPNLPFGE